MIESHSKIQSRNRVCPPIHLNNGRVKLRSSGRVARITCNRLFKLIQGSEIMTCVRGHWDTDFPICGSKSKYFYVYVDYNIRDFDIKVVLKFIPSFYYFY